MSVLNKKSTFVKPSTRPNNIEQKLTQIGDKSGSTGTPSTLGESSMLKTWTDTHYQLDRCDWLYLTKHPEEASVSLVCPGYARDGAGFSIHFNTAHLELLEQLVEFLRIIQSQSPLSSERLESSDHPPILDDTLPPNTYQIHSSQFPANSVNQSLISYPIGQEK